MKVETAEHPDVVEIADLHLQAFPGFFLTSLGKGFLKELYAGFLSHSSGILLVARKEGHIVGFIAGTSAPSSFFVDLRQRRTIAFVLNAIPAILRNPLPVCKKLFYAARYRGDVPARNSPGALLSSIGVAQSMIGSGIAGSLIAAFEQEVLKRDVRSVFLTTDAKQNERVNAFYVKHGYVVIELFKQSGRREMLRYEKSLSS